MNDELGKILSQDLPARTWENHEADSNTVPSESKWDKLPICLSTQLCCIHIYIQQSWFSVMSWNSTSAYRMQQHIFFQFLF